MALLPFVGISRRLYANDSFFKPDKSPAVTGPVHQPQPTSGADSMRTGRTKASNARATSGHVRRSNGDTRGAARGLLQRSRGGEQVAPGGGGKSFAGAATRRDNR